MSDQTSTPAPQSAKTNTMAILALVFAFVFAPVGAILGHVALGQIKKTGEDGRGLALAGVIIGWIGTAVAILAILFSVLIPLLFLGGLASMG
jgi:peptidyl-prolyl cis-trans isomerase B (cyclophilin B)